MGCGISRFERNYDQGGDPSSGSSDYKIVQVAPQQQPPLSVVEGEKDKESSTPEKKELEKIKVKRDVEESKEDGDDDKNNNDKHGHEERDDCFFNYPRSPSFREYCTDPDNNDGDDDMYTQETTDPDNNDGDDDMYTQESTKKVSKSEMPYPKTQDQPAVESGSKGENGASTEDKDEKSSSTVAAPASGLKIRNVLGYNKWGRGGSTRSIRSYFQVCNWRRPAIFNRSSPTEKT